MNIQVKKVWCGIANPSPFIGDTTSCSKPTIYNQGSSISLETPQPPVMICNLALLQAQFSEVAPSVSVNVNTHDKWMQCYDIPFLICFSPSFYILFPCSFHVFCRANFKNPLGAEPKCWFFTGIYTLCKNKGPKCHWPQIWPRTRVHVW